MIWEIKYHNNEVVSSFEGLVNTGRTHFQNLFKVDDRVFVAKVINLSQLFPSFVTPKHNRDLMEEVLKDELKKTLHSFQKDKSPNPDGWTIEFFLALFSTLGTDLL